MKGVARKYITMLEMTACAVATCVTGCCQKDLYFPPDDIPDIADIEFDWTHAENATVEGMSTFFFPLSEGGRIWTFDIAGMHGGPVSIPPGNYTMIAVNNDLPGIDLSAGETESSVTINTRFHDDDTLCPSGMVYGTAIDNVCIHSGAAMTDYKPNVPHCVINASPDSLSTVYNIILKDVSQADKISNIYARLSGVAVSLNLRDNIRGSKSASINIPIDMDPAVMCGSTTALGTPTGTPQFTLTLYAELTDRRRIAKSLTFDITGQVTDAAYPHNVYIILSGISFDIYEPEQPGDSVGMDVGIDGWSNITIDLITGS